MKQSRGDGELLPHHPAQAMKASGERYSMKEQTAYLLAE